MQINVKVRGFSLTSSQRSHAERRLRFALTRFDDRIQRVVMRLSKVNDLRGGLSKRCHLQVVMVGLPDVVVEDTETDLYTAINRAINRAGRSLMLRLHVSRPCSASNARAYWTHHSRSTNNPDRGNKP